MGLNSERIIVQQKYVNILNRYDKVTPENMRVPRKRITKVLKAFVAKLRKYVQQSDEVALPGHMGNIRIRKTISIYTEMPPGKRPRNMAIDWKATKKLGKYVYHLNDDRGGCRYRIHWKKPTRLPWMTSYCFIPCRSFKRTTAKILLTDLAREYYE